MGDGRGAEGGGVAAKESREAGFEARNAGGLVRGGADEWAESGFEGVEGARPESGGGAWEHGGVCAESGVALRGREVGT